MATSVRGLRDNPPKPKVDQAALWVERNLGCEDPMRSPLQLTLKQEEQLRKEAAVASAKARVASVGAARSESRLEVTLLPPRVSAAIHPWETRGWTASSPLTFGLGGLDESRPGSRASMLSGSLVPSSRGSSGV